LCREVKKTFRAHEEASGHFRQTVSYEGIVDSVSVKKKMVSFKPVGTYPKKVQVEVVLAQESDSSVASIKSGAPLNIVGTISELAAPEYMTLGINRISLENGSLDVGSTHEQ
jgi:hypothetical protein